MKRVFEFNAGARSLVARDIENKVEKVLSELTFSPTIKARIKRFSSYYKKYLYLLKSGNPDPQITDLVGIRVICPFMEDLSVVEELLKENMDVVEVEKKGHYTFREFGYESTHLLIKIPPSISRVRGEIGCEVIEIQIRTILQDAWAEVEHELFYKSEFNPFDTPMKRKLAALNANLSLADIIFQEIRDYQRLLSGQLGKRRETFYQKIEESTDALLFLDNPVQNTVKSEFSPQRLKESTIDDLLLSALTAHNDNRFEDAITLYSRILKLKPENNICSTIYKHRGMANFARSKYKEAIKDFTNAIDLGENSYKAAYYRGVVHSVLKQYPEAIDDFTESLKKNPYQAFCLFSRGQAYYHIGDFPKALSDCEASIAIENDNAAVFNFRDLLRTKLKM